MQTFSSKELLKKQEQAKELKRETNNHGNTNQMTQAEAINSAGNQQGNRRIKRNTPQRS